MLFFPQKSSEFYPNDCFSLKMVKETEDYLHKAQALVLRKLLLFLLQTFNQHLLQLPGLPALVSPSCTMTYFAAITPHPAPSLKATQNCAKPSVKRQEINPAL